MMKRPITAALLSLLVFPGTGHVWLKYKKTGFMIIAFSIACLLYLITEISKIVLTLVDDVANGRVPADTVKLSEIVHQQLGNGNNTLMDIAAYLLVICWIGSAVDALRLGLGKPEI